MIKTKYGKNNMQFPESGGFPITLLCVCHILSEHTNYGETIKNRKTSPLVNYSYF